MTRGPTRRTVLGAAVSLPFASKLALPRPRGAGKLLVLGGTRFLGPPIVEAALATGWEVTLFNRGRSNPGRFADLDQIRGDRNDGSLDGLRDRKWDVVVDTSGYAPLHVTQACELLRDHVEHYVFVSTISVYPEKAGDLVDESTETLTATPEAIAAAQTIREAARDYGAMKAECERAAERAMPGRVTVVRPGLIVGPEDGSDRFTYWPVRVARGGEVLAPDDPGGEVQFVDVRDLGEFCFRLASARKQGVVHGVGFRGRVGFGELLHACKLALNTETTFTWASDAFLLEHEVRPYMELPLWLPAEHRAHYSTERAVEWGLTFRPITDTIRDTEAWHRETRAADHRWRAGMAPDRERELLAAWRAR